MSIVVFLVVVGSDGGVGVGVVASAGDAVPAVVFNEFRKGRTRS